MISVTSTCGSSPEDVGTGRKPRLSAQITRPKPKSVSNSVSGTKVAASVG